MNIRLWLCLAAASLLAALSGCAREAQLSPGTAAQSRQQRAAPPESPAPAGDGAAMDSATLGGAESAPEGEAYGPRFARPPMAPSRGAGQTTMDHGFRAVVDDFMVAEAALLSAGDNCSDACRALRSMQRAAAKLCSLATDDDQARRCEEAQARVQSARRRVRNACRICPTGPSLSDDAPLDDGS